MMESESFDAIVIGAGMAGATAAAHLAPDRRVALVEAEDAAGYHSTGRSAAMFILNYGPPDVRVLSGLSRAFFDSPPAGFAEHPADAPPSRAVPRPARPSGGAGQDAGRGPRPQADRDRRGARRWCRRSSPITRSARRSRKTISTSMSRRCIRASCAAARPWRRAGAAQPRRPDRAPRMAAGRSTPPAARCSARPSWSTPPAPGATKSRRWPASRRSACTPCRRTAAIIDPAPCGRSADWPMVIDVAHSWYARPEARTPLMVSPADETPMPPQDIQPDELDIAVGIDRMQQALEIDVRRVERSWAGLRTFTARPQPRDRLGRARLRASSGASARADTASKRRRRQAAWSPT